MELTIKLAFIFRFIQERKIIMKIKEVEKMLQMNLQTIRYYDKQDFLILKEMKMDIEIILWMISKHSKKYVF